LANQVEDSVVLRGGGNRGDEITVVDVVINVVASVGCTGHCDEKLLKNKGSVLNFSLKEGETRFPRSKMACYLVILEKKIYY
jgi:hypothetical protein